MSEQNRKETSECFSFSSLLLFLVLLPSVFMLGCGNEFSAHTGIEQEQKEYSSQTVRAMEVPREVPELGIEGDLPDITFMNKGLYAIHGTCIPGGGVVAVQIDSHIYPVTECRSGRWGVTFGIIGEIQRETATVLVSQMVDGRVLSDETVVDHRDSVGRHVGGPYDEIEDETRLGRLERIGYQLNNIYPPQRAKFSRRLSESISCTNTGWLTLSTVEQASYIYGAYRRLVQIHDLDYPPEILMCKAFKESMGQYNGRKIFQIQRQTSVRRSTAVGISQVTKSSARDLFDRGRWFRSRVEGFEDISDGAVFYSRMGGNVIAQMELGLAILHQKKLDTNARYLTSVLGFYYGNNQDCNREYARRIKRCGDCVSGGSITERCLDRALGMPENC